MKAMRSTKAGSKCADCGTEISIGAPIVYFGPGRVYGLTCHRNEKTTKHLAELLRSEGLSNPEISEVITNLAALGVPETKVEQRVTLSAPVPQEWVVRVDLSESPDWPSLPHQKLLSWLMQARFGGQLVSDLTQLEIRAPRNIGQAVTKRWAEAAASNWPEELGRAEAAPLYVEGGTR